MKNNQLGFIQIPLLLIIILGTLVVTGSGYYTTKHKPQIIQQNTIIKEENKTATTSIGVATTSGLSFASKIRQATSSKGLGYKPLDLSDYSVAIVDDIKQSTKLEPVIQKTDDSEKSFQEFGVRGREILALLEQDENNSKLLTDTIAQHKRSSAELATQMMDAWITLVDQNISSVSNQYSGMLNSTKNYFIFDKSYLVNYSNSLYDIVSSGAYFLDQKEIESLEFVKKKVKECLAMSIKEWVASDELACTTDFLEMKPDYSERLTSGANRLAEIDDMALGVIKKHAQSAGDDIRSDMDSIARYAQLDASIQASYNSINNQLQQRQAQFEAANTPIKCYTSTNDSIFDQNRTYNTTCQPDTRTAQQICDEKIAAWAGSGAYTSKPICE